jgi:hypothetical protein
MSIVNDNYPKKNSEISDSELKALALEQYERNQSIQQVPAGFPTEVLSLPSEGKVYAENNDLSSGKIEMKYMTAREEDILTSQNLIKQGVVLDKLMQSLIVSPIKFNDLIIGDKNAIMIAARVLGYGKNYETSVTCPKCKEVSELTVDLTNLPVKKIPEDVIQLAPNVFEFTLPVSKRVITFSLLTHGTDRKIQHELDAAKKKATKDSVNRELTTRLRHLIKSVDGDTNPEKIKHFVENELFAADSREFRKYIKDISPDQKMEVNFNCMHCGHESEACAFELDTNFFWPNT